MKALSLVLLLALALVRPGPAVASEEPLKVLAGTSLIEDIVTDLTGGRAEIVTLLPGSSCPGHNDVKAADLLFAAKADAVIIHSFQLELPQIRNAMDSAKRPDFPLTVPRVEGSWLVPGVQKEAVRIIAEALSVARPAEAGLIRERAERRLEAVDRLEKESLARLAQVKGRLVAASAMQAQFVRWAGLETLAEYPRAEEMHTRRVAELVVEAREGRLAGVVDNLQSGPEAGLPLARELKVPHLVLSNFPGYAAEAPDYFSLVRINVAKLAGLGSGN